MTMPSFRRPAKVDRRVRLNVLRLEDRTTPALASSASWLADAIRLDFSGPDGVGKDGPLAKIGLDLIEAYHEYRHFQAAGVAAPFRPSNDLLRFSRDRVLVEAAADDVPELVADLQARGIEVLAAAGHLVDCAVPLNRLAELASLASLRFATPVMFQTNIGATIELPGGPMAASWVGGEGQKLIDALKSGGSYSHPAVRRR